MKRFVFLLWVMSALPLAAQSVVSVRSGEHEGYSRLVLRVDPAREWVLEQARGRAELRFPGQTLTFDTDQVFARIGTSRIAEVQGRAGEAGSVLALTLPCHCDVQAFAFDGKYVVIDVHDGPPLSPEEVAAAEAGSAPDLATGLTAARPDTLPYIQPPDSPARFTAYVMAEAPDQPRLVPDPPAAPPPPQAPHLAPPENPDEAAELAETPAPEAGPHDGVVAEMESLAGAAVANMESGLAAHDDPEMQARIEAAQTQLLAQLTRAADQGLVEFVPAPVPAAEPPAPAPPHTPEPEPEPDSPPIDPSLLQQLSARTAYGTPAEDALSEIVNEFAMPQCLDDSAFSMAGWGGAAGFSAELARLRAQMLGEFDTPDNAVVEDIVRLYLRYGLGAEARLIMAESGVELENAPLYTDIAALLEGQPEAVSGPVTKGAGCGGAHEMWYLASGVGRYQVLEPLTITDAFSAYPIEVRSQIGPLLAQAFIDRGQVEEGHLVLEIVRRAESGVTTAQRMAEAQVLEANDNLAAAAEIYHSLALGNDAQAPMALAAYARTLLAMDAPLPETLLVDLETAGFVNRHTEAGGPLLLVEIRARGKVEGPAAALAQISETLNTRPHLAGEFQEIAAELFAETSAAQIGDYPYAQMVLQYAELLDEGPAGDGARLKIASEMAALGLPETALDVLAPNLSRPSPATRHLQAAAHVQLFEPQKALEILAEDDSLEAYKIRLNAALQMEDYAAVAQMLNEPHAREISVNDVALRAGDWAKIQDAGAVGTLASYVQGNAETEELPPMVAEETPSLKAARELLEENAQSMQFLEEVLAGETH